MTHQITATGLLVTLAGLAGCSAHRPLILKNTKDIAIVTTAPLAPHAAPVLVTAAALPESFHHEVIAQIAVGKAVRVEADAGSIDLAELGPLL